MNTSCVSDEKRHERVCPLEIPRPNGGGVLCVLGPEPDALDARVGIFYRFPRRDPVDTGGHLARDVLERDDDPNVPSWHLDDGIEESVEADPENSNANRRKLHEATQAQQVSAPGSWSCSRAPHSLSKSLVAASTRAILSAPLLRSPLPTRKATTMKTAARTIEMIQIIDSSPEADSRNRAGRSVESLNA